MIILACSIIKITFHIPNLISTVSSSPKTHSKNFHFQHFYYCFLMYSLLQIKYVTIKMFFSLFILKKRLSWKLIFFILFLHAFRFIFSNKFWVFHIWTCLQVKSFVCLFFLALYSVWLMRKLMKQFDKWERLSWAMHN